MDQFNNLFENGSQPIRRNAKFLHRRDEDGSKFKAILADGVLHSPSNSLDHAEVDTLLHCGHPASDGAGGGCCEPGCFNISCKKCYENSRCGRCEKGLCLEHKNQIELDGVVKVVCGRCQDEILRQRRKQTIVRFLLSPFVDFKERQP